MRPRGGRQQSRPSLYADDHLEPDERAYYGDDVALDIALERYLDATHLFRRAEPDLNLDDVLDERPDDLEDDRADDVAREVQAWRAAVLDGRQLAWREDAR